MRVSGRLAAAMVIVSLMHPNALAAGGLRVPILVYHSIAPHHPGQTAEQRWTDVPPDAFEQQMVYLRDHHIAVVSLHALVEAIQTDRTITSPAVVITFDDGWRNQHEHAFPILCRLGVSATFFVFTNPIGRDDRFMTWPQLREMVDAGMTVGSHSRTHPYLATLHGARLVAEVAGSRTVLEKQLGVRVEFFAYPFGQHNDEITDAARDAGYVAARDFGGGVSNAAADLWALRSMPITDSFEHFRQVVDPHR